MLAGRNYLRGGEGMGTVWKRLVFNFSGVCVVSLGD